jgi:hypothetical protein
VRVALGIFIIFHAMVYAMYVGQALRWFELKPGMTWPDGSWALSSLSDGRVRLVAALSIGLCSLAMIVGASAYLAGASWGGWVVVGSAALVSAASALLWSGKWADFADHGGIGVLINAAIIAVIVATRQNAT